MTTRILELCASSLKDAKIASKVGVKRIELNSALHLGGLTPQLGTFNRIVEDYPTLDVATMIRCRGGGFNYTEDEYNCMEMDATYFLTHGACAIVFGFLNKDHSINVERTKAFVQLAHKYNKEAVFHRAIDLTTHYKDSIELLYQLGVDRILTSGAKKTALEAKDLISKLTIQYEDKMQILAGSGVRSSNVDELLSLGIKQVHGSASKMYEDHTSYTYDISFDYNGQGLYEGASEDELTKLLEKVNAY